MQALVNHPFFGSVWLSDADLKWNADERRWYVVGLAWDRSDAGSPYMPDDYMGEDVPMNFPATCIRKVA